MEPITPKPAVLIASRALTAFEARLDGYALHKLGDWPSPAAYAAGPGRTVTAAVVDSTSPFPRELIDSLPRLKLIASAAVGYEGVDVAYAKSRGVMVCNARGSNTADTADFAVALLLGAVRGIASGEARARRGEWTTSNWGPPSRSMSGLRVGVVGLGAVGAAVAARLTAFGSAVSWWGPRPKPEQPWPRAASLLDLARTHEALVLTLRADDANRGLIGRGVIDALGPAGVLVNVARGSVVDEPALFDALRSGRLGAAALDVFASEPLAPALVADVPNLTVTPHIAAHTLGAVEAMAALLQENLRRFFAGEPVLTPV